MPKNRKEYSKQYAKKNYKKLRPYKTAWEMAKRDRARLLKIKEIYYLQISPLLKNIKSDK